MTQLIKHLCGEWSEGMPLPTGENGDYWVVKGDATVELNGLTKHLTDGDWLTIAEDKLVAAPKWSYSRISTFDTCLLKYYYRYVNPFDPNQEANTEAAHKGSCFHEMAEQMESGKSLEAMQEVLEAKIVEHNVDRTKYSEDEAFRRFMLFWPEYVTKKEAEGYVTRKEFTFKSNIDNHLYTGNLDLSLYKYKPDGSLEHAIIFDYKSPKSSSAASYKKQIVLYAYMVGQTQGWDSQQIYDNIDCFIFFPFSDQKHDNDYDNMLASVKRVNYKPEDVDEVIKHNISIVREADSLPWDTCDIPNLGSYTKFGCDYCPYLGSIEDKTTGFPGCKCSYDRGFRQNRGLKFESRLKKEAEKAAENLKKKEANESK